ncbi:MAG: hypothetical protein KME20_10340 [Kaiparowitsia implicata GSE-PSE-MK54-09C]|jgi:hypothetical protein|nr:hypothetical protein [Kaiparowitsia implicata GSE-PSE-MK54-09C]
MEQEQECLVQTVEVTHGSEFHRAAFYVENCVIHARIDHRNLLSPLGNVPAADTVRALLTEHLTQRRRVTNQARRWLSSRWLYHEEPGA